MDKTSFVKPTHESILFSPIFGTGDTVPIDQQPVKKFNIDPATGAPMSDITAVLRSQGLDRERMLANLEEFRADFLPENVSNEDALKYMTPRLCQMPSELAEYSEFVTQRQLEEQRLADEARQLEEFRKSFDKDDKDVKDDDNK